MTAKDSLLLHAKIEKNRERNRKLEAFGSSGNGSNISHKRAEPKRQINKCIITNNNLITIILINESLINWFHSN